MIAPPTFTGPAYEPMGKIEAGGEEEYAGMQGLTKEMMAEMTPESLRGMMDSWDPSKIPAYAKWNKEASYVRKSLGGKRYHPNAKRTYAYLHTKNG